MTLELPLIDDLRACGTDEERAEWLRRCPDSVVAQYHESIRVVMVAKFIAGLPFLWARLAAVQAVRQADGRYPIEIEHNVAAADILMGRGR